MKRHGNLFEKITDVDNIYLAYRKARKGKSWQNTISRFDDDLDENIFNIRDSLIEKTFTTSPYTEKMIYEPKQRIIYKLPFNPDRIVQHALMNALEPIWNSLFIHDSYSCRKGKGIHAGSRRTMDFIRAAGAGAYCLKMDIHKFYPSIDHDILFKIVQRKIKCPDTLWLLEDIIYSIPGGKNVPIGNYTSQWLGNLYLNELDQYLKHKHKIKHYIRYCDDFILLNQDKKFLRRMAEVIEVFLADRLGLRPSKNDLFPVRQGIDFLGYRHFPDHILVRKSTSKRIKRRMRDLPSQLARGEITADQYRSSIASTEGWLLWANSYNFKRSLGLAYA
ncbi:MAG: Reverse transcriptase (RNA-dependent DNA polymerase) [Methanosaeta sp. PtaU1.Bin060]|nr:MAG: Reverse transcriptase (RNA-dependent DNA polymerase) [Methanosaeta sp. PtaU1.Bin060]